MLRYASNSSMRYVFPIYLYKWCRWADSHSLVTVSGLFALTLDIAYGCIHSSATTTEDMQAFAPICMTVSLVTSAYVAGKFQEIRAWLENRPQDVRLPRWREEVERLLENRPAGERPVLEHPGWFQGRRRD